MAVAVCPSCHERFRYDSREELEVLAGDAAVIAPDGGPLTYRSHQRVVHACPTRRSGLAAEPAIPATQQRAQPVTSGARVRLWKTPGTAAAATGHRLPTEPGGE